MKSDTSINYKRTADYNFYAKLLLCVWRRFWNTLIHCLTAVFWYIRAWILNIVIWRLAIESTFWIRPKLSSVVKYKSYTSFSNFREHSPQTRSETCKSEILRNRESIKPRLFKTRTPNATTPESLLILSQHYYYYYYCYYYYCYYCYYRYK